MKKKDTKKRVILQGDDAAKKFEEVFDRMTEDATLAMKILDRLSGGKLKKKFDEKKDKNE